MRSIDNDSAKIARYGAVVKTQGNVIDPTVDFVPGMTESEGMVISLSGNPQVMNTRFIISEAVI